MLGRVVKSTSVGPFLSDRTEHFDDTSEFISTRAMAILTRAAKRTVYKQQQSLMKSSTPAKPMTAKVESRKRPERRSLVSSAPPILRPPLIVIEEASNEKSEDGLSLKDAVVEEDDEEELKTPEPIIQSVSAPATAPMMGQAEEKDWEEHKVVLNRARSPPGYPTRLTRPRYQTPPIKPRSRRGFSRPATTDWDWVRTKLLSRDSIKRPETSMTFDDFLDGLDLDSDEYDTDLEDAYFADEAEPYDPTGIWHYKRLCKSKGIAPAQEVLRKLKNETIQFKLNHRYINAKDTAALTEGIRNNDFIQDLDLSNNCISDKGARHVAKFMKHNRQIYRLDLTGNCLQCDAGRHLAEMVLHNRYLTTLCLKKNKLGDKEALLLAEVLRVNRSLRSLDVSHNEFGDDAGEAFAAMLMDNKTIISLNLSWNSLRKRAAAAMARGLDINSTLLALDLSYNGIGDDGAALLGRSLKENTTLRFLSLAVNHICAYGADQLANGVSGGITITRRKRERRVKMGRTKCALQYLNLDRNPLGAKGVKALLTRLSKEKKLKALSIREVVLSDETLKLIQTVKKTISKNIMLLYEGQDPTEQIDAAASRAVRILNEAIQGEKVTILEVVNVLDVRGHGALTSDLRNVLAEYSSLTELEVEYAVRDLDINNDDIVQYKDVEMHSRGST